MAEGFRFLTRRNVFTEERGSQIGIKQSYLFLPETLTSADAFCLQETRARDACKWAELSFPRTLIIADEREREEGKGGKQVPVQMRFFFFSNKDKTRVAWSQHVHLVLVNGRLTASVVEMAVRVLALVFKKVREE